MHADILNEARWSVPLMAAKPSTLVKNPGEQDLSGHRGYTLEAGADPQPKPPEFERLLSDIEVGELLGLHPKTVQRMARSGGIPAVRIGRYRRFRASALEHWIAVQSSRQ